MTQSVAEERVEAVIISGPRKGEIISLNASEAEPELSAEEEAMLDLCATIAERMVESARDLTASLHTLERELDAVNRRLHEPVERSGIAGEVDVHDGRADKRAKGYRRKNSAATELAVR